MLEANGVFRWWNWNVSTHESQLIIIENASFYEWVRWILYYKEILFYKKTSFNSFANQILLKNANVHSVWYEYIKVFDKFDGPIHICIEIVISPAYFDPPRRFHT